MRSLLSLVQLWEEDRREREGRASNWPASALEREIGERREPQTGRELSILSPSLGEQREERAAHSVLSSPRRDQTEENRALQSTERSDRRKQSKKRERRGREKEREREVVLVQRLLLPARTLRTWRGCGRCARKRGGSKSARRAAEGKAMRSE